MAKKSGPGDVVRYVPAAEAMVAALSIGVMTILELVFSILFIILLIDVPFAGFAAEKNSVPVQQAEAFCLGGSMLTLAAILSIYRKFFLPDVMIVKKRKLKYEDLM